MSTKARAPAAVSKAVSPEEYSELVASAEMQNIRLVMAEFLAEAEAYARDRSTWKQSYDCVAQEAFFDPVRSVVIGLIVGEAICKVGRKRIIRLKCRYIVNYAVHGEVAEAAATMFIRRVGVFAAYPYFRAHFAEVCSQAGLILPPLPVLKEPPHRIPEVKGAVGAGDKTRAAASGADRSRSAARRQPRVTQVES